MKKDTYILIAFLLFLIEMGCDSKHTMEQNRESSSVATDISRNLSYPAMGKLVDSDSLAKPKTVPILSKPKAIPARNNIFVANPPTPIPHTGTQEIITPGENGVPVPDTILMHQEVKTVRQPGPSAAGPLTMKPEAITDIQYLSVSQGLKNPFVSSILEDRRGNLWIKTANYLSRYDGQHFIHYTSTDGIDMAGVGGSEGIRSMLEDSRGDLWLGGYAGLSRYDGNRCISYTFREGQDEIIIISMLEDQEGKLWFGTYYGVFCYDPLTESRQGQFVKFTTREGLIDRRVGAMLQDHKGRLWFGTGHGLSRLEGKHFTNYPIEGENIGVRSMIEDSQGILWLGTNNGLIRFDPSANAGRGTFTKINIDIGRVNALTEDDQGNIWVAGYRHGLFCLLRRKTEVGKNYLRYTQNEGINGNYLRTMLKDSHGNIWIGGQNGGVSRINVKVPIRYYNQTTGLKGNNVDCIFEDSHGFLWFGVTESIGAVKYDATDGGTFTNYGAAEGMNEQSVTSLMEDGQGNIWMGSWGGNSGNGASRLNMSNQLLNSELLYSDKESFTYFNDETGLQQRTVFSMLKDSRGNLWFGNDPGVTYFEPDYFGSDVGRFFHFPLKGNSFRGAGAALLEDRNGHIWIGSGGGLYKLDLNLSDNKPEARKPGAEKSLDWAEGKTYTHFTTNNGLIENNVRDIMEDSQGILWFVTTNRLSRLDPVDTRFYSYGPEDGLFSDNLSSMAEDRQKRLWILSQSGINVMVPDQKNVADSSGGIEYQFFAFSAPDGFRTIDSGFKNILVTGQNQLWWATGDGVASLDLNNFGVPEDAPKINLNSIEIEQAYIDFSGFQDAEYRKSSPLTEQLAGTFDAVAAFNNYPLNLALPYNLNHLTFHFSAIDWASPYQLQYSYLMEGMDDTWSELSAETKVDYRNLSPGDYIFKVKAQGIAKKWSEEFAYPFTIRPPWWLTRWAYAFYGVIFVFCVFLVDRVQRKRLLEKAHAETREKELEQAREIEKAYHELKSTQFQLIQSEKMASLGELTAGIAHEIQNPLNFVNNFSEVNRELLAEMKDELKKGNIDEVDAIADDVMGNEEKISSHGQRASGIVKGMLEHSRTSDGKKEPTDINALADEYLRLAYHGLRAKDNTFNADFKTEFEESLPKVNVVPQDIGRVLLNLINNAFYVVDKKAKEGIEGYKPLVEVSTKKCEDSIEISVKDNGPGIPEQVRDKIFQPFFTTKPTGQGTGLGLSLSYDILKAHGGEIQVKTIKETSTEFFITLPIDL